MISQCMSSCRCHGYLTTDRAQGCLGRVHRASTVDGATASPGDRGHPPSQELLPRGAHEALVSTWHLARALKCSIVVRTLDSQSRETQVWFLVLLFQSFGNFFHSTLLQLIQMYKWVPDYRQWLICERRVCAVITVWLNASQRSRDGVRMNRSALGEV